MDPGIWSTLPNDLVQLIFARLPLADIFRLQVLSKEWNWNVTARDSEFRKVCSATQCKIFGLMTEGGVWGSFVLEFYDIKSHKWHILENNTQAYRDHFPESPLAIMVATDGGLVCCIERLKNTKEKPLLIMVCNPLTGAFRKLKLPSGALRSAQPSMVQLVLDDDSKAYQVVVVGPTGSGVVYHSASDTWTSTESRSGFVFGEKYQMLGYESEGEDDEFVYFDCEKVAPSVFDCASSHLLDLRDDSYPCAGQSVRDYILLKDRLFVLLDGSTDERCGPYSVTEYQGQKANPNWTKLREYSSSIDRMFSGLTDKYIVRLYACEGIVLITASPNRGSPNWDNQGYIAQFCDLSTGKWHDIPAYVPESFHEVGGTTMCELRWDAFP